jgi:CRP/FNR family cyclic AMP-dependent transcriptional regulator
MAQIHSYSEILLLIADAPRRYQEGDVIFEEGDQPNDEMYIVREGTVQLFRGGERLQTLEAGAIFGEMALLDPAPRSARAVAGPDCEIVAVDEYTFLQLVQRVPGFALELLRLVVRRLRRELERP